VPERGEDAIEVVVPEREVLRVTLDPLDVEPSRCGPGPPRLEQLGHEIEARDAGAVARGGEGGVSGTACDVEHAGLGVDLGAGDDALPDVADELRERRIVARRPDRALQILELLERRLGGCHSPLPW
jgi:hypothetical protein